MNDFYDEALRTWKRKEELAEAMLPLVGHLYRDRDVVLSLYGRKIVRESAIGILKAHRYTRQLLDEELEITDTYKVLVALSPMALDPARLDLGELTSRYLARGGDLASFLARELKDITRGSGPLLAAPQDVVLYGFGRIGRLVTRTLLERTGAGDKLRLRAVVVRGGRGGDLAKRASLLRRDSVHGPFVGTLQIDEAAQTLTANGNVIRFLASDGPGELDYREHGIDNAIIVDNTGRWRDAAGLERHLVSPGAARVLLTAPGKGEIKNIVYGVNHASIGPEDRVLSAASCTTNAIVPVLKVVNDKFGVTSGHIETVHSYTNDQNLIDNFHSKERRGRSAPLNMVLTETGAARAVAKALPELAGRLTGNAIRVPTPNVSLAILNLQLERPTSREALNAYLRDVALHSELRDQIDFTSSSELVSSDLVGSQHAGIVDAQATIVHSERCTLYIWYDNEAGYSYQVVRIIQAMAGLHYPSLP